METNIICFPNRGAHSDFIALIEKLNYNGADTSTWGFFEAESGDELSTYIDIKRAETKPKICLNEGKYLFIYCSLGDASTYAHIANRNRISCLLCGDKYSDDNWYFVFRVQ